MPRFRGNGPCHQMFTGCWTGGHRLSALWFPFTAAVHSVPVPTDLLTESLTGPWSLALMSVLVLGDAFFVVVPGEIAVTALGALAVTNGAPPLWAVIVCAAIAACLGDVCCYLIGRAVGTDRWRWMRTPKVQRALEWARRRLDSGTATVLFTARFVPFARLAINLVAGASRIHPPRYLALVALAATGWAAYQAAVGAAVAAIVPGGPLVAVPVSIGVAVAVGVLIDVVTRRARR
ncbi:DedA family protein [Microbacterium sp. PMB16]|uniref:DedA family protein n=1 Tax=Microbacterium sp. PMB16 TaxID=3120157 RepID=UPI003F4B3037